MPVNKQKAVEPKEIEMPGWGMAIDPDKEFEITDLGKSLRITIPGNRFGKDNSPRVMRDVEGDFIVTVKVVGDFRPGGKSTNPKFIPVNGAGILLWRDTDNHIRLERAANARPEKLQTYVNFAEVKGGTNGASHAQVMKGGETLPDCWVRMERKGSRIQGSVSIDGKTWDELPPIQTVWPANLKVGLAAGSTSSLPFSVTFEEFELKGNSGQQPTGATPRGWVVFKSPVANYSLAMPQQPTAIPAGGIQLYIAKLPNGTGVATHAYTYPANDIAQAGGPEGALDKFISDLGSVNKVSGQKKLMLGQYSGRECQQTHKEPQGSYLVTGSAIMHTRAYLVGNHMVVLQGPASGDAPSLETAAFFNSLKLGN
jgi:regulation of enolase protein 1 (concanavalin A-like superfamily)